MSSLLRNISPFHYLNLVIEKDGGLGYIFSPVGSGKTQLLTHLGLYYTLESHVVLHISLTQTIQKLREMYEQSFSELLKIAEIEENAQDRKNIEKNRLLHAHLDADFSIEDLKSKLSMFHSLLDFSPAVILIDDYHIAEDELYSWHSFAKEQKLNIFFTQNTSISEDYFSTTIEVIHKDESYSDLSLILRRKNGVPCQQSISFQKNLIPTFTTEQALSPQDCTLFSGGAMGSEEFFGKTAHDFGCKECNFTFKGHDQRRTECSAMLNEKELSLGSTSLNYVARKLRRNWDRSLTMQKILQVLWHVVSHSEQVFIVGVIQPDNTVHGGTGWSVELAKRWHKPVWVYDQDQEDWFRWDGTQWKKDLPTIQSKTFAGSGTRFMSKPAQKAIQDLFERSFSA